MVHKWTSLISTVFLLILCVTGLPLVFHQEIDNYLNPPSSMPAVAPGTTAPTLDTIVADALKRHPGDVMVSLGFFRDRPAVVLQSAPTPRTPFNLSHRDTVDLRTGKIIDLQPEARGKFTTFLRELHTDLFLGLPGSLFLGVMALMLITAVVSGVVIYAPFMRRLARAHANCVEGLPVFGGLLLVALVTGRTEVTDALAPWLLGARIVQSGIHLASTSVIAVNARFTAFAVQMGIGVYWTWGLLGL